MTRKPFAAIVAACLLATPAVADAHITLQPKVAVAGSFTEESVRVPNERDTASTYTVEWRALARDGHHHRGSRTFIVR